MPISREMRTWSTINQKTEIYLKNTNSFWFWVHHQQSNKKYLFPSFSPCVILQSLKRWECSRYLRITAKGALPPADTALFFSLFSMTHYSHFMLVLGKTFSIWPNHGYFLPITDIEPVLEYILSTLERFFGSGKADTAFFNQRALSSSYRRTVPEFSKAPRVAGQDY